MSLEWKKLRSWKNSVYSALKSCVASSRNMSHILKGRYFSAKVLRMEELSVFGLFRQEASGAGKPNFCPCPLGRHNGSS